MEHHPLLRAVAAFRDLTDEELDRLHSELVYKELERGEDLVRQGEPADDLFLALSGRFVVTVAGQREPVAEIPAGAPIGEIAFFSGGERTATVTAARDSVVLRLGRRQFDTLSREIPGLTAAILKVLADRLAAATARLRDTAGITPPRTIAILPAGGGGIPARFVEALHRAFEAMAPTPLLTPEEVSARAEGRGGVTGRSVTMWLNDRESRFDHLLYLADPTPTEWSMKVVRQADLVLLVAAPGADPTPNELERHALTFHRRKHLRLVLAHETREDAYEGTPAWLATRDVFFHHHVAFDTDGDFARLCRFLTGQATGFVACGGGAFCAAHIGVYHALLDAGIEIDIYGGSSGGGAMTGAFARGLHPDEVDRRTHDIFVRRRAMRHLTLPRYGLIDHKRFDGPVRDHYGDVPLEDIAIPYFALSTNLRTGEPVVLRTGPHWEAVRATSAIPGLLPPFVTADGELLVDGSLSDNVPLLAMQSLKSGPNIVVDFSVPDEGRCPVKYDDIPGRVQLLARLLSPFPKDRLPPVPSIPTVVLRSLMMHGDRDLPLAEGDLLLAPPLPPDMGILEWTRHTELARDARAYTVQALEEARRQGHPLLS